MGGQKRGNERESGGEKVRGREAETEEQREGRRKREQRQEGGREENRGGRKEGSYVNYLLKHEKLSRTKTRSISFLTVFGSGIQKHLDSAALAQSLSRGCSQRVCWEWGHAKAQLWPEGPLRWLTHVAGRQGPTTSRRLPFFTYGPLKRET